MRRPRWYSRAGIDRHKLCFVTHFSFKSSLESTIEILKSLESDLVPTWALIVQPVHRPQTTLVPSLDSSKGARRSEHPPSCLIDCIITKMASQVLVRNCETSSSRSDWTPSCMLIYYMSLDLDMTNTAQPGARNPSSKKSSTKTEKQQMPP